MKLSIIIVFALLYLNCNSQSLKNTEWIQVTVESKDVNKNQNLFQPGTPSLKYFFLDSTVLFASNDRYNMELKYSQSDSSLKIGANISYRIDTITDAFLIVTEIPKKGNINPVTATFLNVDFLFDYLKKAAQLNIIGDSLIMASNLFSPAYKGIIDSLFILKYSGKQVDAVFKGYFTVTHDGRIKDIGFVPGKRYKKWDMDTISDVFMATQGSWIIPPTPKPYDFKLSFTLTLTDFRPLIGANVYFNNN